MTARFTIDHIPYESKRTEIRWLVQQYTEAQQKNRNASTISTVSGLFALSLSPLLRVFGVSRWKKWCLVFGLSVSTIAHAGISAQSARAANRIVANLRGKIQNGELQARAAFSQIEAEEVVHIEEIHSMLT